MSTRSAWTKPVIGIVGGIGAGKSTAAAELVALGCALIDADRIGHELLADEDVRGQLAERWGGEVFLPDGQVDRRAVASKVFADPRELDALNDILHPRMRRRMEEQIAAAQADPDIPAVVLDAAVLFEAGWDDLCTCVVFVSAPASARRQRSGQRHGWTDQTWLAREKSQISLDFKADRCNYVVDNSSSASHLREQVRQLFHRIVPGTG